VEIAFKWFVLFKDVLIFIDMFNISYEHHILYVFLINYLTKYCWRFGGILFICYICELFSTLNFKILYNT